VSHGEQHIETKRFRCPHALDFDTAPGLLNRRALAYHDVSFGNWYKPAALQEQADSLVWNSNPGKAGRR
jgi:hypothetical protein